MRRNLLCFVTGAVVTLAVVLLVKSGQDRPQPAAASTPPAAVDTTAREPAPNVKLRGHHVSPHGHRGSGGTTSASSSSTRSSAGAAAAASRAASTPAGKPSKPRGTDTTPTVPEDETPTVPDDTPPPTDTGTTSPPSDDGSGSGSGATTTPQTDSAVTIPNQATPDGSVGAP